MSSIHFDSEHSAAEVWGAEFGWLNTLATTVALEALQPEAHRHELVELIDDAHYLRVHGGNLPGSWGRHFTSAWIADGNDGQFLRWRDRPLYTRLMAMNTAVAIGDAPMRFAMTVAGQADVHGWIDGPDRPRCADIVEEALEAGHLRRTVDDVAVGWESVVELLRMSTDGAVVMSYSVEDRFPYPQVCGYNPSMPGRRHLGRRGGTVTDIGAELSNVEWDEYVIEAFGALPRSEQWRLGVEALRARTAAGLQIRPDRGLFHFGPAITVLDLVADDRDARLERAFADDNWAGAAASGAEPADA